MPTVSLQIAHDHPAFAGHFPGQPLLPDMVPLADAESLAVLPDVLIAAKRPA